ncbi:MAG: hypothetical protein FWD08_07685 [Alphaproteobacteria bacterium]|nr:hypothetical protein [Alphaproteobacteria bacterium]
MPQARAVSTTNAGDGQGRLRGARHGDVSGTVLVGGICCRMRRSASHSTAD